MTTLTYALSLIFRDDAESIGMKSPINALCGNWLRLLRVPDQEVLVLVSGAPRHLTARSSMASGERF
jgi:hypothetical protein